MQMIGAAVSELSDLATLVPVLQGLGKRHHGYGVQPQHYSTVGQALLATLALGLDSDYPPEVAAAWTEVDGVMAGVMQDAAVMA